MNPESRICGRKLTNVIWNAWNCVMATVEMNSPSVSEAATNTPAPSARSNSDPRTGRSKSSQPSDRISETCT